MMSGGYYEPILAVIPEEDRQGQIRKMTETVAREFGYNATGIWLAERVWEPSLPGTLNRAGVEWTVVDDTHFKMVGLDDEDLLGYYLTEDQGLILKVFGTSKYMRYAVPWRPVNEVIAYLRDLASDAESRIVVMGDDGEKFGLWPGTKVLCWDRGWIENFFSALEGAREWLAVMPPGEWMYTLMSFSGSSASRKRSWAMMRFAMLSSIGMPMKIIRSFKRRE